MNNTRRHGTQRAGRIALAIAPILALTACDQIAALWNRATGDAVEQVGPIALDNVPADARGVAFAAIRPEDQRADVTVAEPAKIVPGEVIVGARLEDSVARVAAAMDMDPFALRLAPAGPQSEELAAVLAEAPEALVTAAEQDASTRATSAARTVLRRLGVDAQAQVEVSRGGSITIDLTPEMLASPTSYTLAGQAADPAATPTTGTDTATVADPNSLPEPESVVDDPNLRCPRTVDVASLRANEMLLTQCAVDRLRASRQFEFVEKNYVIEVGFDRPPRPQPQTPAQTPPPAQQPSPVPGTLPPATQAPAPSTETAATGALPNDPLLALQWHYRPRTATAGQVASAGGAGFETYWTQARQVGSRRVHVAVIDTGLDLDHPDMRGSPNIGPGIDVITSYDRSADTDGVDSNAQDPGDACGPTGRSSWHGTHVAGTVGAALSNKGRGVAGGAWNVTVVPVRALGRCGGELEDIINGIRWAAGVAAVDTEDGRVLTNPNPADIINMSLSIGIPCPASMQAAIDQATARGAIVVVAAGNKANPAASFAPANCNNVVVVAAGDARGNMAFYSNFGPQVDVMAPGGDVFADADNDGRPDGVLSTLRNSDPGECYDPATRQAAQNCWYGYQQGTSMAAPHVSAALALLRAETNLRGRALERTFFERMVLPYDNVQAAAQCQVPCANNINATPIPGQPGQCMRLCGRGVLDLTRAVRPG